MFMRLPIATLALSLLLLLHTAIIRGQGCSDGGVCSLPGAASNRPGDADYRVHLRAEYVFGAADQEVSVHTMGLRGAFRIGNRLEAEAYLPYQIHSGDLGSVSGLGDPVISGRLLLKQEKEWRFYLSGGVRMPINTANNTFFIPEINRDYALPMVYQTSLGTWDLLGSVSASWPNKWLFVLGGQYAHDWNDNTFLVRPPLPDPHPARRYPDSNQLRRKPDLLFRAERLWALKDEAYVLGVGLLGIVKIMEDQVYYPNTPDFSRANFTPVPGSSGLTLNAQLTARVRLAKHLYLQLLAARPLVVRDSRPDGLGRSFILQSVLGVFF
jgi:hypothetical protein